MKGCLVFSLLLATLTSVSADTNAPSGAQVAGQQLAQRLVQESPAENSFLGGAFKVRAQGKRFELPVNIQAIIDGAAWQSIYETVPGTNRPAVKLVVTHAGTNANRYELDGKPVAPEDAAIPFAGTDFWLSDLGLEFLHWPGQRIVKKEFRRNCACTVLESLNPAPKPGNYTRVVSWIDQQSGGIVHAEAYDGTRKLKVFDPKEFKKVNGRWQLQEMQIENLRTASRTALELNLGSK